MPHWVVPVVSYVLGYVCGFAAALIGLFLKTRPGR